ncbi:TonB-dependent receptor plug domain-containing protein [Azohydromonas lata]|uniref:TonB-dependent receptor n=1 Tax=Azohydromonas lata TaxID=45677 RepID=A0ABU5IF16_9BURK|nr:TonB-dependent receptor [Azohydromonas lata]MDZ5457720.1 TonB-dependent receptor [Azohydromonas lata]
MSLSKSLSRSQALGCTLAAAACAVAGAAVAQTAAPPGAPPVPASGEPVQRVEITGERSGGEVRERRESTAAKTVIGREDIERFGDASLGEVLKRLPGVTLDGAPGRGGSPRLRGLGNGYTQILLDGEQVPRGFEIDSLAPEQIERIEILRAPTAETGARAVAGTINIITRENFKRRANDLRLSLGLEDGRWSPGLNWSRNGSADALAYTFNLNALNSRVRAHTDSVLERGPSGGAPTLRREETVDSEIERRRLTFNGRLQWRLGEGESFTLTPFAIYGEGDSRRHATLAQQSSDPDNKVPWTQADPVGHSRFTLARLSAQRNQRLADGTRLEWRASAGRWLYDENTLRPETGGADPALRYDDAHISDRSWSASVKASTLLADAHSGVAGVELEGARRREQRSNLADGVPLLPAFDDGLQARSQRVAVYAQDEWDINPRWAAQAGLRWESIETRSEGVDGDRRNRSAVWSPVLHTVWKFDAKKRDQLRMSLSRSYRALTLGSLVGSPVVSTQNSSTSPDRAGNPALRPELATGLDVTLERYLGGGGVLSAGVFHREISDLVRNETRQEGGRWVNRPYNVGDATVQGLELEAKFALREVLAQAPALDVRSGVSFFRSRVHDVPGPDNRVDQQPGMTANLGADWKPRGTPLTLGGNLHWTPGYVTRLSAIETARVGRKPVFDAYALWTFNPSLALRLSATNFSAPDFVRGSAYDNAALNLRESSQTVNRTYVDWLLRLEMKL